MARLKIVYDAVTGLPRQAEQWGNIQGKPEKYPPEEHEHKAEDITDLEDTYVPRQELKEAGLYPEAKWPEKTADYNDMTEQGVYYMGGYFHHNAPIVAGAMLLVFATHEEKFTRIVQIAMPNVTDYKHPTYQAGAFMRQSWTPDAEVEGEDGKEPKKRKWTSWLPFSPLLPRDDDTLLYYKNGNFESLTLEQLMNKFGADERYIKKLELSDKGIFPALNVQTRVNDFNAYQEQGGFWFPMGLHINAPPTKHGSLTHGALLVFNFQTGVVQIYYDALDDKLYSRRHEQQQWYPWKALGGVAAAPPAVVSLVIPTDADNDNLTLTLQASEDGEFPEEPKAEGDAAAAAAEDGAEAESKVATITMKQHHGKMKVFGSGKFMDCPESGVGTPYYGSLLVIPIDSDLIPGYEPGKRYFARYRWADKSTQAGEWRALIIQ